MEATFEITRGTEPGVFYSHVSLKGRSDANLYEAAKQFVLADMQTGLVTNQRQSSSLVVSSFSTSVKIRAATEQEVTAGEHYVLAGILRVLAWEEGTGILTVTATEFQPQDPHVPVGATITPAALPS